MYFYKKKNVIILLSRNSEKKCQQDGHGKKQQHTEFAVKSNSFIIFISIAYGHHELFFLFG